MFSSQTFDTITDFVRYLRWKEAFLESAKGRNINILYCGEGDLLANYLLSTDGKHHGFALPEKQFDTFCIDEGDWNDFLESPQRSAQINADKDSYFWDDLIEKFCKNILAGTSHERGTPHIAEQEKAVRMLALEPRTRRRILARALIGLLRKTAANVRAVRVALPDRKTDPYFCFLLMPRFDTTPIETSRQIRGEQLEVLIRVTKFVYPEALDIIGFATESGANPIYRSEDLIYLDARKWSAEEQEHARQLQKDFNFLTHPKINFSKDYDFQ